MSKRLPAKSMLWLTYGLVLFVLVVVLFARRDEPLPDLIATADLPKGHRLSTGDIRLPGAPHYLRREVKAGQKLTQKNLSGMGSFDVPKGTVPVILRIDDASLSPLPNKGSKLWICPAGVEESKPVPIVAVFCDDGDSVCFAVAAISAEQAAHVGTVASPRLFSGACPKEG